MAALLSDLLLRSGTSADAVESRLGWEPGRLNALLAGQKGLTFEALLEILPVLDSTPGDFFARLAARFSLESGLGHRPAAGVEARAGRLGLTARVPVFTKPCCGRAARCSS